MKKHPPEVGTPSPSAVTTIRFAKALFKALRLMDREACCTPDGDPTGLSWYGGFFRPECSKPPTETSWTRRLEQLLPTYGFPTEREVCYPHNPRLKCDNVVTLPGGARLWLENKGAWRDYWTENGGLGIYRSYLLHPLVPGLDPKTHTVPLDLKKLSHLRRPAADYIGFLLLGFDTAKDPMDADVARLIRLARLDRSPWVQASTGWRDRYRRGRRVLVWLWCRPVRTR
jgi:hypothetical protein